MSLREHIEQLADELGIAIHWDTLARYRSGINVTTGEMYLAPWDAYPQETYWVAMHELGHFVDLVVRGNRRGLPDFPSYTEAEARAWEWALDNALPEALPLGQVGESNIAWSITDYMNGHGWNPSPAFQRIFEAVGPDPDWFYDVTTPEHYAKLDGWAKPMWAKLVAEYGTVV